MNGLFRLFAALILLCTFAGADAQEDNTARIHKTLKLPVIDIQFNFGIVSTTDEISIFEEFEGRKRHIGELRQQIALDDKNPQLWSSLAQAYNKNKDEKQEEAAYAIAEKLSRQQMNFGANLPAVERAKLMAQLGTVLRKQDKGAKKDAEAEKILREAVKIAPEEGSVWKDLSEFLASQFLYTLYERDQLPKNFSVGGNFGGNKDVALPPTHPKRIARLSRVTQEASDCLDKAIVLAPKDGALYLQRFMLRSQINMIQLLAARGKTSDQEIALEFQRIITTTWLLPESRKDLRSAALYGATAYVQGTGILFDLILAMMDFGRTHPDDFQGFDAFTGRNWEQYPEETRQTAPKVVKALEKIAASDAKQRAMVHAMSGMILMQMGQKEKGIALVKAALTERPTYTLLWDLLLGVAFEDKNLPLMESILKGALVHWETVRYRLILAKTYDKMDKPNAAQEQINLALKKDPQDALALLYAATFALRDSSKDKLAEADRYLDQAEKHLAENEPLRSPYELLRGVSLILSGKTGQGTQKIQAVLDRDPENEQAKDLLAALKKS